MLLYVFHDETFEINLYEGEMKWDSKCSERVHEN